MDKLINLVIINLSLADIIVKHLLLNFRMEKKITDKSKMQEIILLAMKTVLSRQIKLTSYQLAIRILLMIMWIINTMYQRNIVFICYLLAVTYSLMVYFSFQNLKKLKITKHIYETVINKKLKEEKISKEM